MDKSLIEQASADIQRCIEQIAQAQSPYDVEVAGIKATAALGALLLLSAITEVEHQSLETCITAAQDKRLKELSDG